MLSIPRQRDWEKLNSQLGSRLQKLFSEKELAWSPKNQVQVYQGAEHALCVIAESMVSHFSHKRAMSFISPCGYHFRNIQVELSRQGLNVGLFKQLEEFPEEIPKGTLFVAIEKEHPVTAEKYSWEGLRDKLNLKKVYTVILSHQCDELIEPMPYEIVIHPVSASRAYALLGSRVRLKPLSVRTIDWSDVEPDEFIRSSKQKEFPSKVVEFERSPLHEGTSLFQEEQERNYDRALLYWEDIAASALVDSLKTVNKELKGVEAFYQKAEGYMQDEMAALLSQLTPAQRRGLLIVDAGYIEKISPEVLAQNVGKAYKNLKVRQKISIP